MIKLRSGTVIVAEGSGSTSFDLDELQQDLVRACATAHVREPELADDLVDVVRRFCRLRSGTLPTQSELEHLVIQALADSGLSEVARVFQHLRRTPAPAPPASFLETAGLDIEDLLARDPFFLARPTGTIAGRTRQALEQLGLTRATPAFVQSLARHLWYQTGVESVEAPANGYWLIGREEMEAELRDRASATLRAAGVRVRPVSTLFPRLNVDLELAAWADHLEGSPLTELVLLPAFDDVCRELAALLGGLVEVVRGRSPILEQLPVTVRLRRFEVMAGQRLRLPPRQQLGLRDDLHGCLRRHLPRTPQTPLEII